ncbi:MAG: cryptochrome/photolyase family protein [Candidatus Competibacterales bacterium]
MATALVWLRRDLRLADNPALSHAAAHFERVILVYVLSLEEEAPWDPGAASRWWLHHSLQALGADLARRRSALVLRRGPALATLKALAAETKASAVFWNRLYEPAVIARDKVLKAALTGDGLEVKSFNAALLAEPWTVKTGQGEPYKVFTPFWRALARETEPRPLAAPELPPLQNPPPSLDVAEFGLLPRVAWYQGLEATWRPGEAGAVARLDAFIQGPLARYESGRNRPDQEGVSRLSPHLHFGEVSPGQVWRAVAAAIEGDPREVPHAEAYIRELGWREFAHHVLYYWPHTPEEPLQARFAHYPWVEDYGSDLAAWQRGQTGIPIVDAAMIQLWQTGWMHNRLRMIVASFLTKNLRIPWQEGTRWFWDCLVDANLASNTMGWQWTAGSGTDAAPYFRVFNPVRQGGQYDPEGAFVKRYVPALEPLPAKWIHNPWEAPGGVLVQAGVALGETYPKPLVDLKASRQAALKGYEAIKGL